MDPASTHELEFDGALVVERYTAASRAASCRPAGPRVGGSRRASRLLDLPG